MKFWNYTSFGRIGYREVTERQQNLVTFYGLIFETCSYGSCLVWNRILWSFTWSYHNEATIMKHTLKWSIKDSSEEEGENLCWKKGHGEGNEMDYYKKLGFTEIVDKMVFWSFKVLHCFFCTSLLPFFLAI